MAAIINIPQRLQIVNGTTAIDAGIRMLPLLLFPSFVTAIKGMILTKWRVPPLYMLVTGASLQAVGVGLFSSLDSTASPRIPPEQYGYQVIMGCGFGCTLSTVLMMVPLVVREEDMGAFIMLLIFSVVCVC